MNKRIIFITFILVAAGLQTACNKTKTYTDYLKDQNKAIDKFIKTEGITVLKEYPANKTFNKKEFYLDPSSGIYYNVIDSGNGRRIKPGEEVYIRFTGMKYFMTDTTSYTNIYDHNARRFTFGNTSTYPLLGWVVPLQHVGDSASVRMIVPFDAGSSSAKSKYQPTYFDKVFYRFER